MSNETVTRPVPDGESTRTRKFGVSDLMYVIAAAALAIAGGSRLVVSLAEQCIGLYRTIAAYNSPFYSKRPEIWRERVAMHGSTVLWYGFQVIEVLVLSLTPALLLIRLRQPRPSMRATLRQPGTVAGLAVAFGYFWVTGWLHGIFYGRTHIPTSTAIAVGGTVAVAWSVLSLSRRWEAKPSWVDRMGRLLGAVAIVAGLLAYSQVGS